MCVVIRTHLAAHFSLVGGVDRYVVHRHVMRVVIRAYLDTRFFSVGGGRRREARAGTLAPATTHAPAYMSLNISFTLVPDTAWGRTYPGCALPVMSMRIGTAMAVLCGSLYLYVVCIASEGGTLFRYVRVFRLTRTLHPSTCQLLHPHRVH